jgi:hypothetical protein
MLPNGSFAVGLVTSFTGVYCVLIAMKNRSEIARYGSKAELHKFGDFNNFAFAKNYDRELSLRLNEQQRLKETTSEFALMTNKVTSEVSAAIKRVLD